MTGLYVHVPFCKSKCTYCDFVSFPGREGDFSRYQAAVLGEMSLRSPLPVFDTAFFGGGTPSAVPAGFMTQVLSRVTLSPNAEVTTEANPGSLDAQHIAVWRAAGINRLSLGVQARQDHLLALLGRTHRWAQVEQAVALWNDPQNLSLDLMYGLPGQTMQDWLQTLHAAVALNPGHLSCYSLIVEEGTPLHGQIASGSLALPDEDLEREMHHEAGQFLARQGYHQYEISNYARDGHICRHNMNYWQRGDYIGLGCAAHSFIGGIRSGNAETIEAYITAIESGKLPIATQERIDGADADFEELMLGLRLTQGVQLSPSAGSRFRKKIAYWTARHLLSQQGEMIRLTPRGLDVMNSLLTDFLSEK